MTDKTAIARAAAVEDMIITIRGQRVMLDADLARLYEVETKALNRAVLRNPGRFPDDFMFQLTADEYDSLRCQFGTLKRGQHAKYLPRVFTEQGVAMLSSVLHSERAVQMNVAIMRAFVRLRQALTTTRELTAKLAELDARVAGHDRDIRDIIAAIRQLMTPQLAPPRRRIGFHDGDEPKASRKKGGGPMT